MTQAAEKKPYQRPDFYQKKNNASANVNTKKSSGEHKWKKKKHQCNKYYPGIYSIKNKKKITHENVVIQKPIRNGEMYLLSVKSKHKFFSETVCLNSIFLKSLIKEKLESILASENSSLKNLYGTELFIPVEKLKPEFNLRGGFEKKILFITSGEGVPLFIPEIETMFQRMLTNLKSSENEIGLIDLKIFNFSFSQMKKELQPQAIVAFGIKPAEFGLHIESAKYVVTTLSDFTFSESDSFAELYKSDAKKKEVFPALKKLFSH